MPSSAKRQIQQAQEVPTARNLSRSDSRAIRVGSPGIAPLTDDDHFVPAAEARIGTLLCDKYRLDSLIGVGSMAAVYAATNLRNARRVAAKVLHGELMALAGLRERFVREGYVANGVGHAGAVRVFDNDTSDDGAVFLIMELLEGETLQARWERHDRHLSVAETAGFVRDLLDVLAAMHDKGVIHRDIKPANLFVTREGCLKVLDFGIARRRQNSATQTLAESMLGTPAFMPPEQALGRHEEVDALSDLWAAGATAFSLLSGRFVHESATVEEALINAATLEARPLASVVPPSFPPGIARVIDRALAFDKWDRWQSARAMKKALVRAMDEVT